MSTNSLKVIPCNDWNDFDKKFEKNIKDPQNYIFRGQYSSDWKIETSFQRYYKKQNGISSITGHLPRLHEKYDELKSNYLELIKTKGILNSEATKDINEVMCYAQHHHLPTMLIDWSTALDSAIFFSVSDEVTNPFTHDFTSVYCLKHKNIRNCISDISIRNALFLGIPNDSDFNLLNKYGVQLLRPTNFESLKTNLRIDAQEGVLTEFLAHHESFEDFVINDFAFFDKPILFHFIIPHKFAKEKLQKLSRKSLINFKNIYPDIYGYSYQSCFEVFHR